MYDVRIHDVRMYDAKMCRCKMCKCKMWRCKTNVKQQEDGCNMFQMFTAKMSTMKMCPMKMYILARFFEEPFAQTLTGMTRNYPHASRDMQSESCIFRIYVQKHKISKWFEIKSMIIWTHHSGEQPDKQYSMGDYFPCNYSLLWHQTKMLARQTPYFI